MPVECSSHLTNSFSCVLHEHIADILAERCRQFFTDHSGSACIHCFFNERMSIHRTSTQRHESRFPGIDQQIRHPDAAVARDLQGSDSNKQVFEGDHELCL